VGSVPPSPTASVRDRATPACHSSFNASPPGGRDGTKRSHLRLACGCAASPSGVVQIRARSPRTGFARAERERAIPVRLNQVFKVIRRRRQQVRAGRTPQQPCGGAHGSPGLERDHASISASCPLEPCKKRFQFPASQHSGVGETRRKGCQQGCSESACQRAIHKGVLLHVRRISRGHHGRAPPLIVGFHLAAGSRHAHRRCREPRCESCVPSVQAPAQQKCPRSTAPGAEARKVVTRCIQKAC